jgi:serine/threonine protein kinase
VEKQGTPQYMAPEVHNDNNRRYGKKCDVWSLGIMLFFMLTGQFPFKGSTEEEK